jgi:hypothetical protein
MKELEALYYVHEVPLDNRTIFNTDADQFVDCLPFEDPIYVATLADRLMVLATKLKESVKDIVPSMIMTETDENSGTFYGDTFTLTKKIDYIYPSDAQLEFYNRELTTGQSEIEPFKTRIASIEEAIKTRQKQLVVNGDAIIDKTTYNYSVKKK